MTSRRVTLSEDELRDLVARAAKAGAHEALAELGLFDAEDRPAVARDIKDLRDILKLWRDIQADTVKGLLSWVGKAILTLVFMGAAVWAIREGTPWGSPK